MALGGWVGGEEGGGGEGREGEGGRVVVVVVVGDGVEEEWRGGGRRGWWVGWSCVWVGGVVGLGVGLRRELGCSRLGWLGWVVTQHPNPTPQPHTQPPAPTTKF